MTAKSHSRYRSPRRPPREYTLTRLAPPATLLVTAMLLAGLLLNCAPAKETLSLPGSIGSWNRSTESPVDPSVFPESLRRLEAVSARGATYEGPDSKALVTVYEMPSATSAFEAVQTYHRNAGEYYFQKGTNFVVLSLAELDPGAQRPFLLDFQKALSPDGPRRE